MKRILLALVFLAGCTPRNPVEVGTPVYPTRKVELYSAGTLIGTWTTNSEIKKSAPDCYGFTDKTSGKQVDACGTVVITEL